MAVCFHGAAGQTGTLEGHLVAVVFEFIVGLGYALRGESVGFDDVGPCFKVAAMYVAHHIGARNVEQVVVALELYGALSEPLSTEIVFRKSIALHHSAQCSVEDNNPFAGQFV